MLIKVHNFHLLYSIIVNNNVPNSFVMNSNIYKGLILKCESCEQISRS